jgi:hypothetical protein
MDTWQALLIFLFNEGREWATKLDQTDWRREIANSFAVDDPKLQIVQATNEAHNYISTPSRRLKGFVIAPGKYDPGTLVLLVPLLLKMDGLIPKLSLQVGILRDEDGKRSFFGYRFESPEGFEEHNFYHAQPIQAFKDGGKCSHAINWYPYRYPTFPLKARNAFELVASMILACRDSQHMRGLATSQSLKTGVKQALIEFLQQLTPPTAV